MTFNNEVLANKKWFLFVLLYLLIDYGRPQDILPIKAVRPGMIIIILLTLFLIFSGNLKTKIFQYKQIKLFIFLVLLLAIYVPFAVNNYWANKAFSDMAKFIPLILSIPICVDSIRRLKILIQTLIVLMVYVSIYGILHKGMGSGGYFVDENDLSLYINSYLPFSYFLFFYEKQKIKKIFYLLSMTIGIIAIVLSFSRGGFIGLASMLIVAWYYSPNKIKSALILCILIVLASMTVDTSYMKEMESITNTEEGTANERILSWTAGWRMFLDNPLGVGGNNFMIRFPEYQPDELERGMWGRAAHSLWFTLLPELGIFGIFIYFRMLYLNISDIKFLKNIELTNNNDLNYLHSLSLAFMASLAGFFASGTFLSVLYYPHYYYITALIVVSTILARNILKEKNNRNIFVNNSTKAG